MVLYEKRGDAEINRGLIGFWKLNDKRVSTSTAIDYANFNDGTITGCTNVEGINGLNPDAMLFNGIDDNVDLNRNFAGFKKLTCLIWVFRYAVVDIIDYIIDDSSGANGVSMRMESASGERMKASIYDASANFLSALTTTPVPIEEWVQLGLTYDGIKVRVYFNGVLQGTSAGTGDNSGIGQSNSDVHVGSEYNDTKPYNGVLFAGRFYDRVLTDGEISKLHRLKL